MKKVNIVKKAMAIILSLVMVLGMGSIAFANEGDLSQVLDLTATPSITPEAAPTYKVVYSENEHGTINLEKAEYQAGESVLLNIEANDGFELASISAYETKDVTNEVIDIFNDKSVKVTDNSFVMPTSDVRVVVSFTEKYEEYVADDATDSENEVGIVLEEDAEISTFTVPHGEAIMIGSSGGRGPTTTYGTTQKYVLTDTGNPDITGNPRAVFCVEYQKEAPTNAPASQIGGRLSREMTYVLLNGVRYHTNRAVNPAYRGGDAFDDYWITAMALHIINGEFSLTSLRNACQNPSNNTSSYWLSLYDKVALLVNDANKASSYNTGWNTNRFTDLTFSLVRPDLTLVKTARNGVAGWATADWITPRLVTNGEGTTSARTITQYIESETISFDATGVSLIMQDSRTPSPFKMWISETTYKEWQKTGKSATLTYTARHPSGMASWIYGTPESTDQNVALLQMTTSTTTNSGTATIKVDKVIPHGSIEIKKTDSKTGGNIVGTEFTVYEWVKATSTWKEHSKLTYSSARGAYILPAPLIGSDANDNKFRVTETKASPNYINASWSRDVTLQAGVETYTFSYDVKNTLIDAKILIAKLANKTTNAELVNGKYEGGKDAGMYYPNQRIDYTLTATNAGNVPVKDVVITETMDAKLLPYVKEFDFDIEKDDELDTTKGAKVKVIDFVKTEDGGIITLDKLAVGDSVEFHLIAELVDISKFNLEDELDNVIKIVGKYNDDYEEKTTNEDIDNDDIILGVPKFLVAKLADKTTNAELIDGKYEGSKDAGMYYPDQVIAYTLTATNAGNTLLKDIVLEDTIDEALLPFVKEAGYVVAQGDILSSVNGEDVEVIAVEDNTITLSELKAGDSIDIHYVVKLVGIDEIKVTDDILNNIVVAKANYPTEDGDIPAPEDKDEDDVLLIKPEIKIAKLADKTINAELIDGKYEGSKDAGEYKAQEKVDFKLIATNTGNIELTNVTITDVMSQELAKYVEQSGYTLKVGDTVKTQQGNTATVVSVQKDTVILDKLEIGDSVEVHFIATLKEENHLSKEDALNNSVKVVGTYTTDEGDKTVEDEDEDDIKITVNPPSETPSTPDTPGTTKVESPKTGDTAQLVLWFVLGGVSLASAIGAVVYKKRKAKKVTE